MGFGGKVADLRVTLKGATATEIRRIANNLNVETDVLVNEGLEWFLKEKYGLTVK